MQALRNFYRSVGHVKSRISGVGHVIKLYVEAAVVRHGSRHRNKHRKPASSSLSLCFSPKSAVQLLQLRYKLAAGN